MGTVDGRNIATIARQTLREQITNVPQDPLLLELTLRENLSLEGDKTDAEIWAALEAANVRLGSPLLREWWPIGAQCKDIVEQLEGKLDTEITGEGGTFSRGQRVRSTSPCCPLPL